MQLNLKDSFSKKSILMYISVFVIIMSVTVGVSYVSSTKRLEQEVTAANIALLKQISDNIDMRLRVIDREVINLLGQTEIRNFIDGVYVDSNEKYFNDRITADKLINLMNSNENISSMYVHSAVSNSIISDKSSDSTGKFFDNGWIEDLNKMTSYSLWLKTRQINDTTAVPTMTRNVISLIRPYPISNSIGFKKGSIVANVDENVLYNVIRSAKSKSLDHIFIVDKSGEILSHDDKKLLYKNISNETYMDNILKAAGEGSINRKIDGIESSVFYITSPYTGWKYVSIVPKVVVNKPLAATRNILIIITFVMLSIGVAAIIAVSNWTYRPINKFILNVAKNVTPLDENNKGSTNFNDLDALEKMLGNVIIKNEVMERQINDSIPVIKGKIFSELLMGAVGDKESIDAQLKFVNVKLHDGDFIVMAADIDNKSSILESSLEQGFKLYKYALDKISDEFINQENRGLVVEMNNGIAALIISFESKDTSNNTMTALAIAEQIKNFINLHFKITVTIGVGNCYGEITSLHKSYKEALEALKYKVITGSNTVISIEDIGIHDDKQLFRIYPIIDTIIETIKDTDSEEVEKNISRMFSEAIRKNIQPDAIRQLCMQLIMRATKEVSDIGIDIDRLIQTDYNNVYEVLNQFESIDQMKCYLEKVFNGFMEKIIEKRKSRSNKELMDKVLKYINNNYMDYDLTLNSLSDAFNLSVPYLSKIFKENVEANFTDYLISIRMEKAKELLGSTDIKINEITQKIGYANAHSFIRIFKKYTGRTPGEYRNESINRELKMEN